MSKRDPRSAPDTTPVSSDGDLAEAGSSDRWRRAWQRRRVIFAPLAVYLVALGLVQVFGGLAEPVGGFPERCPEASQNCTRIADQPFRGDGRDGVRLNVSSGEARAAVLDWVENTARTEVTHDGNAELEVLARTRWMRYPDDMYVRFSCEGEQTLVEIHSESRLGAGDLGVNDGRVLSLVTHIESYDYSTAGEVCTPLPMA